MTTNVPENALEAASLKARDDPFARPVFYGELMNADLVVIGRLSQLARGGVLDLAVANHNGCNYHLIFSSLARKHAFLDEKIDHVVLDARSLFEATRGSRFVLNPGWAYGKELTPGEIAYWLGTPIQNEGRIGPQLRRPDPYPSKLVKALSVLFVNRRVRAAHLVEAAFDDDNQPRILVGVDTEGDWDVLELEIAAVAAVADAGLSITALHLEDGERSDLLCERLLEVPPFYIRSEFNQ
jgi:hypothetical protein